MERLAHRLARRLRHLRGDRTQANFASKLGIAPASLNRIEQGTQNVTLKTLDSFCSRLGCDLRDLFPTEDEIELAGFKSKAEKLVDVAAEARKEVVRLKELSPADPILHRSLDKALEDFVKSISKKFKGK